MSNETEKMKWNTEELILVRFAPFNSQNRSDSSFCIYRVIEAQTKWCQWLKSQNHLNNKTDCKMIKIRAIGDTTSIISRLTNIIKDIERPRYLLHTIFWQPFFCILNCRYFIFPENMNLKLCLQRKLFICIFVLVDSKPLYVWDRLPIFWRTAIKFIAFNDTYSSRDALCLCEPRNRFYDTFPISSRSRIL